MTKNSAMTGTTDHSLSSLVGKKIKSISMQEIDIQGDGQNVRQFYMVTCTDGEKFVLAADGNSTQQYATVELMDVDEFADLLEEYDCEAPLEEDSDLSSGEEEDSEDEDEGMFDDDDKLFDDQDDSLEDF